MMKGCIVRRGKNSWRLKFDLPGQLPGIRSTRYHSFKGSRREAELELARLITAAKEGTDVSPSRITVDDFLDRWERDWAATNLSPKTLERQRELARVHVRPHLGRARLQTLRPMHLAEIYAKLQREGRDGRRPLAPRTIGHIHRLLHRALGHAVTWGLLAANPASAVAPPRVEAKEIEILSEEQVRMVLAKLKGHSIYPLVLLGLATGARRGELAALRWRDVDLDAGKIRIEQSLEQTRDGLRFKPPKTRHGRRTVAIAPSVAAELRAHRRRQQEARLERGLGKMPDDALVFGKPDGSPTPPETLTVQWRRVVKAFGLPAVSMHAWRHTHVSQLIASGVDLVSISRRLGHASSRITLEVYAHAFDSGDDRAAQVVEAALAKMVTD